MPDSLDAAATILVALAALVHVAIFLVESVFWRSPKVHARFGVKAQRDAEHVRVWAFNQGFYNLFLALGALAGILLSDSADVATRGAGVGMALLSTASMLAAAVVLALFSRGMIRPALVQGIFPLGAVILILTA